jgi:LuxR family transcriptional regulator of spore coat protein
MTAIRITPAQKRILTLLCDGKSVSEIAQIIGLSYYTARTHKLRLMELFEVYKDTALVAAALRRGVIE